MPTPGNLWRMWGRVIAGQFIWRKGGSSLGMWCEHRKILRNSTILHRLWQDVKWKILSPKDSQIWTWLKASVTSSMKKWKKSTKCYCDSHNFLHPKLTSPHSLHFNQSPKKQCAGSYFLGPQILWTWWITSASLQGNCGLYSGFYCDSDQSLTHFWWLSQPGKHQFCIHSSRVPTCQLHTCHTDQSATCHFCLRY